MTRIKCILLCICCLIAVCGCTDKNEVPENSIDSSISMQTETVKEALPEQSISAEISYITGLIPQWQMEYLQQGVFTGMSLQDCVSLYGSQSVRETPQNHYAVLETETGEVFFLLFNAKDYSIGLFESAPFPTNAEFMDLILGNHMTLEDMEKQEIFTIGLPGNHPVTIAYYTQEGIFILGYFYKDTLHEGSLTRKEYGIISLEYLDYEDLVTSDKWYADGLCYILPEDRVN